PMVVTKAEAKPAPMAVAKAEPKSEPKPEPMVVTKAEPKVAAAKFEPKEAPKAEAKAEPRFAVASATSLPVRFNSAAPPAEPAALRSVPALAGRRRTTGITAGSRGCGKTRARRRPARGCDEARAGRGAGRSGDRGEGRARGTATHGGGRGSRSQA